jgi:glyoxylase-like metal-dependent hydrolase (beta-lactamase superfamily II)/rhodanese-related sulfurtransferase
MTIRILVVETPALGDRSYVATDGDVAVVVDPQRDIDRVLELVGREGIRVTHVAETHLHNDYVTGGLALAQATGATYLVPAGDQVTFDREPVADGDVITVGSELALRVIATPGHTFNHVSYAMESAVFTGGSLLYGSVGRTDLVGAENAGLLARAQHASVRKLADLLPADAAVYPTHGFGSFCAATPASGSSSTIAAEAAVNPALTKDEDTFVAELLRGLGDYPAYYAHMAGLNADGPGAPDLTSPVSPVDVTELTRRIKAGAWVVDLRHRTAFAAGHLAGSLNFGVDGPMVSYLGWLIPWGAPLTLIGTLDQVAAARRELARIGIDRLAGAAPADDPAIETGASFPVGSFAGLAAALTRDPAPVILDVRARGEWDTARIAGAVHLPLPELPARIAAGLPDGEIWVHCAGGYRASIAASLLDAAGRDVVAVEDSFEPAAELARLPVIRN